MLKTEVWQKYMLYFQASVREFWPWSASALVVYVKHARPEEEEEKIYFRKKKNRVKMISSVTLTY